MIKTKENEAAIRQIEEEALARCSAGILTLSDNFESIYDVDLETLNYSLYIKGDTKYDEISTHFISGEDFFKDSLANIDPVVYEEDRDGVAALMNEERIRKVLEKDAFFDWYYRLMVDGNPVWYRMRFVYKDFEKRNVILGVFNAAREVANRKQAEKDRNDLIAYMSESGESLYIVNPQTERFQILTQNEYLSENYKADETYSQSIGRYIKKDVYKGDKERIKKALSLEAIEDALSKDKEYIVTYRDISSGTPQWYEMRALRLSDSEIIYGFRNRNQDAFLDSFKRKTFEDQFALYSVDMDTLLVTTLKKTSKDDAGSIGTTIPYKDFMKVFADALEGRPKAIFTNLMDPKYAFEHLKKEDKLTYSYQYTFAGSTKWVMATAYVILRHEDGSPSVFTLGFSLLDTLGADRQEIQDRMQVNADCLSILEKENTPDEAVDEMLSLGLHTE